MSIYKRHSPSLTFPPPHKVLLLPWAALMDIAGHQISSAILDRFDSRLFTITTTTHSEQLASTPPLFAFPFRYPPAHPH
jgi:hypothetical protein